MTTSHKSTCPAGCRGGVGFDPLPHGIAGGNLTEYLGGISSRKEELQVLSYTGGYNGQIRNMLMTNELL